MNTSSRLGRATDTALIEMPSSANSRGTNASPFSTPNVTAPSRIVASMANFAFNAAIAAASSAVRICTRSSPTFALSASGVPSATI